MAEVQPRESPVGARAATRKLPVADSIPSQQLRGEASWSESMFTARKRASYFS